MKPIEIRLIRELYRICCYFNKFYLTFRKILKTLFSCLVSFKIWSILRVLETMEHVWFFSTQILRRNLNIISITIYYITNI